MDGMIVEHWQHGTGLISRWTEDEIVLVLFEKDNKERWIPKANLTTESGRPLVAAEVIGRVKSKAENNLAVLYDYIRDSGKPVFTDYPSCPPLMQELNSRGGNFGSAGTVSSSASQLRKRGLVKYAGNVRGSGWVSTGEGTLD